MSDDNDFSRKFAALREHYAQQLPAKLNELESSYARLAEHPADTEALDTLHRQAHSLTGSGASFGYIQLSQTARTLENALKKSLTTAAPITPAALREVRRLLDQVQDSVRNSDRIFSPPASIDPSTSQAPPPTEKCIAILDCKAADAELLAAQLTHFGYTPQVFHEASALGDFLAQTKPAAVLIEISGPDEIADLSALTTVASIADIPLVFISERTDLHTRLQAVRAGGIAFFSKPVETGTLVDQLDNLSTVTTNEPYRVLIVDDQPVDAALYASALDAAGMITHIVTDPAYTLDAMRDFNPELVLMDMYMPGASGEELTTVIRQQAAYVSIPLVFLSAEKDVERQLMAMRAGADDFLTKPINMEHLITSVTTRARRYRSLRGFMQRDSLTGLLNHTKSKEFLDIEVARAERDQMPLSFAMVDIDHFKHVNDTYGHAVGDRVIKSLSRLLQQRLRRSDIIGRYGGEEFAVILPNTSGQLAASVMDELRDAFAHIQHHADGAEFTVTFSCGIAEYYPGLSTNQLASDADKAMYEAKRQGRNRVILARHRSAA